MELGLKEKFFKCPYCNHLIGSDNPICKNCGLEMSSEGIIELAEIEELEKELNDDGIDFSHIYNLRIIAIISFALTLLGYFFCLGLGNYFFFKLYFWFGLFSYYFAYTTWNNKFPKENLSFDELEIIKKEKLISLSIFLFSTLVGTLIYIFLLK